MITVNITIEKRGATIHTRFEVSQKEMTTGEAEMLKRVLIPLLENPEETSIISLKEVVVEKPDGEA